MTATAWWRRALLALWLVMVWLLLWGTWRPDVVLFGVVVAVAVLRWSTIPAPPSRTRIRWARLLLLVARSGVDLLRSSWEVTRASLRTGDQTRSSVVRLRVPPEASDVAVALACNRVSLEPGSAVVDVDRDHDRVHVYEMDTPDLESVERRRAETQRLFDEVLEALPARGPRTVDERGGR